MYFIIYQTTNIINGKIYVGKHETEDLNDEYLGSGTLLTKAIRKYGRENFRKTVLHILPHRNAMLNKEKEIVNEEFVARPDTYNLKVGGHGGFDYINTHKLQKGRPNNNGMKRLRELAQDPSFMKKRNRKISKGLLSYYDEGGRNGFDGKHHTDKDRKYFSKLRSGTGNTQFGTCWIYRDDLQVSKKIQKSDLQHYLDSGWIKGRKIKFGR